ncbi:MAG: hypothetical protein J6Y02_23720 [Pseudobutyrivibrio sp.]|nr:hypothetical protein [Pseudobutyrivibrio sp.]
MTLVESLKKFLAKLGGDPNELENNATSAEVIDAISEAYTDKEGTYTEVNPIVTTGTKIATITTNNTEHDIYAPYAPTKTTILFTVGELEYDERYGSWTAPVTMSGTEEQIFAKLLSNNKNTIEFSSATSGTTNINVKTYAVSYKESTGRASVLIVLEHNISNEFFKGTVEYRFSNTKSNAQSEWDVPLGTGYLTDLDVEYMLYTINLNKKLVCHLPWNTSKTRALTYGDAEEGIFGHFRYNPNIAVRDESGHANMTNTLQYPMAYYVDTSLFAGGYGKNYDTAIYIAFEKMYQQSQSSDIILKKWYYEAAGTFNDYSTEITLTKVEIS